MGNLQATYGKRRANYRQSTSKLGPTAGKLQQTTDKLQAKYGNMGQITANHGQTMANYGFMKHANYRQTTATFRQAKAKCDKLHANYEQTVGKLQQILYGHSTGKLPARYGALRAPWLLQNCGQTTCKLQAGYGQTTAKYGQTIKANRQTTQNYSKPFHSSGPRVRTTPPR